MMRFAILPLIAQSLLLAQAPAADGPEAVVQKFFDAVSTKNVEAARSAFIPDASLYSLGSKGQASRMPIEEYLKILGASKAEWKERVWNLTVLVHGVIAVVWAPYDFHLGGAFSHCGYDSISLLKTSDGWKITYISDTRETQACSSPLGPPEK